MVQVWRLGVSTPTISIYCDVVVEKKRTNLGHGGGPVVNVLAFYYDDTSSKPFRNHYCEIVCEIQIER